MFVDIDFSAALCGCRACDQLYLLFSIRPRTTVSRLGQSEFNTEEEVHLSAFLHIVSIKSLKLFYGQFRS